MSEQKTETPEQIAERTEAAAASPGIGVDVRAIMHAWGINLEEAAQQPRAFFSAQAKLGSMLSEIWQTQRLSCLKRSTIGAWLLGTLDEAWSGYVEFHIERLGCEFCRANLDDLRRQTQSDTPPAFHQRIMQSTVGFLSRA